MKKAKLLLSVLLLTFVLVGCGSKKDNKEKKKEKKAVAGDTLDIKLDENSSAGYSWTYELDGDDVVVISNSFEPGENCGDNDGCPGYEIFTITATAPGEVTLTLTYKYHDGTTEDELVYNISIDKDLRITETHK